MILENAKLVYLFSCVVLGLIILSPTFFGIVPLPEGERFSVLWLLGPNHMIQSGSVDVSVNKPCTYYLGVENQMGDLEYYTIYVKFRSESQAFLEPGTELPSSFEPVFEYRLFLRNNETWETDFVFSFEEVLFDKNMSQVSMLSINGNEVSVDTTLFRDETDDGFYCQMLFELWIYNPTISASQYHNRFVQFWINLKEL